MTKARDITTCSGQVLVLGALMLTAGAACSDLAPGEETFCDVNAGIGNCGTVDKREDTWWCLDQQPPPLPLPRPNQLVGFVLPAVDWSTRAPLAGKGLTATLCPGQDFSCASPLAPPYYVREGSLGPVPLPPIVAGVPVPEGFDGFIRFDVQLDPSMPDPLQYVSETYYLGGVISGDMTTGGPIIMVQRGLRQQIIKQSFPQVDANSSLNLAVLAFGVYDCNGDPVSDARIEINVGGSSPEGALPFQLPASRIPIAQRPGQDLYTDTSGLAGFLNVPPGSVQLTAYQRGDAARVIGRVELGAVAGQISVGSIRPAYVLDANLRNVSQVDMPTAAPAPN